MKPITFTHRGPLSLLLAAHLIGCSRSDQPSQAASAATALDEVLLVEAEALRDRGFEGLVLDTRPQPEFEAGHIPGAISLPTNKTFAEPLEENNFLARDLGEIQELFRAHGINNEDPVLVYDKGDFKDAARMFWVMETHGVTDVRVLDGGWGAWLAAGGEQGAEATTPPTVSDLEVVMRSERQVLKMEVLQAIEEDSIEIIDARPLSDYVGKTANEARGGHVPTARNIEWTENKRNFGSYWRFKTLEELQEIYARVPSDKRVIVYCNKGKQSAVAYLALRRIGRAVAAYDGSWYEWSRDEAMPIMVPVLEEE